LIAVGAASFFCGVGATLLIWFVTRGAPPREGSAVTASAPASSASTAAPASAFVRVGKPDSAGAEAAARAALAKLRDGIGTCVKDVIGVLPGTSPAVPTTMKIMKNGVYATLATDYRSPVFTCAHYQQTDPQPYQLQWQHGAAAANEGTGVAWIDTNGDGEPDRAFGFTAKLVKKREVTLGEIGPLDPMPKLLPWR
jgi:hypothetical protein